MRRSFIIFSAALALAVPTLTKAEEKKIQAPAEAVSTQYNTKTAKVLEVDYAKNTLALEGEGGTRIDLKVDPAKVKNFKNVKKGDLVVVQTTESWALSLTKKAKGEKPNAEVVTAKETAPVGSKPGMDSATTAEITAEITKVDVAKSTVELKGPAGNLVELKAKDPKNLEGLKKGDMVTATYTMATAISVEAAPKK